MSGEPAPATVPSEVVEAWVNAHTAPDDEDIPEQYAVALLYLDGDLICGCCGVGFGPKLPPDPEPYLWNSGGRTAKGSRWGSRPPCRWSPRPGYSQDVDDYH